MRLLGQAYAVNEQGGQILISHDWRTPVLMNLDYAYRPAFDKLFCFLIADTGFLLLEVMNAATSNDVKAYRRIGCARECEDGKLWEGAPSASVCMV